MRSFMSIAPSIPRPIDRSRPTRLTPCTPPTPRYPNPQSRYNPLGWAACGLGWALWLFGGGPIQHDPLLMELTKAAFGRERPSPIHRTASFPSGHTTAVVLLVGALLFVLLPAVYGNAKRREAEQEEVQGGAEDGGEGGSAAQPGGFFGALYGAQVRLTRRSIWAVPGTRPGARRGPKPFVFTINLQPSSALQPVS